MPDRGGRRRTPRPAPPRRRAGALNRIRVVGSSGSGKSTTAAGIAERLSLPHLELDSVHWLAGWKERDADDFRRIVRDFAEEHPRWVIDGNYNGRLGDVVDDLVDTYVWLDLPRWRTCSAVALRTVRRAVRREELWAAGNRERLRNLFDPRPAENLVLWSWQQYGRNRVRYGGRQREDAGRWIRLRSREEINRFLAGLGGNGAGLPERPKLD